MSAVNITTEASELAYNAVVIDKGSVVLGKTYATPSERRDAVIELLKQNHNEVSTEEIDEVLLPFGGANADVALQRVVDLFTNAGAQILVMISEKPAQNRTLFQRQGVYGDSDEFKEFLREQDEEAMQADYPEGVSPSLPTNVERLDGISEWLAEEGFDLYMDTLSIPKAI